MVILGIVMFVLVALIVTYAFASLETANNRAKIANEKFLNAEKERRNMVGKLKKIAALDDVYQRHASLEKYIESLELIQ